MQELLEYFIYNYRMQNPYIENLLLDLFNRVKDDETISQDVKNGVFKALQMARGLTEYKASTVASDLGLAKSRVKALMKQAVDEGKVELVVEYDLTFIKPVELS